MAADFGSLAVAGSFLALAVLVVLYLDPRLPAAATYEPVVGLAASGLLLAGLALGLAAPAEPAAGAERLPPDAGSPPDSEGRDVARYRVVRGDTLDAIACRYGLSVEALRTANAIEDPRTDLKQGMDLTIPLDVWVGLDAVSGRCRRTWR